MRQRIWTQGTKTKETASLHEGNNGKNRFGSPAYGVATILHLQRTVGNKAVCRLLQGEMRSFPVQKHGEENVGASLDANEEAGSLGDGVGTRLEVGSPDDAAEQEADGVA